jgi:hypothetical protein
MLPGSLSVSHVRQACIAQSVGLNCQQDCAHRAFTVLKVQNRKIQKMAQLEIVVPLVRSVSKDQLHQKHAPLEVRARVVAL